LERIAKLLGYALLRATLGFVLFFWGIDKFQMGVSQFAAGLDRQFDKTWLPALLVHAFGFLLPFAEVGLGLLLIVGLFTAWAAALGAVLLILLNTGMQVSGSASTVANNLVYSLILFVLLFTIGQNRFSLDGCRRSAHGASGSAQEE
jgi:thiosulfate dehydrogenase [quinone] large subunit